MGFLGLCDESENAGAAQNLWGLILQDASPRYHARVVTAPGVVDGLAVASVRLNVAVCVAALRYTRPCDSSILLLALIGTKTRSNPFLQALAFARSISWGRRSDCHLYADRHDLLSNASQKLCPTGDQCIFAQVSGSARLAFCKACLLFSWWKAWPRTDE